MKKTILITGSTDGIGLEAAKTLVTDGHNVLLHGRNEKKLKDAQDILAKIPGDGHVESYLADMSRMEDVEAFAKAVTENSQRLDALINNAGVYKTPVTRTPEGLDVRFVVNTIAPYLLTQRLLPLLGSSGRVVNLSSAAQAPVDLKALAGQVEIEDMEAYAQSKLAITMWSRTLAGSLGSKGPVIVAVNPGSLLATKMVKEGFGVAGSDIGIGADIIIRAALSEEFANASGKYFDNDSKKFASPHPDALDAKKSRAMLGVLEAVLVDLI